MTRPNGIDTNYTYDNLSRLLSVLHQLSGSTIDGAATLWIMRETGQRRRTNWQARLQVTDTTRFTSCCRERREERPRKAIRMIRWATTSSLGVSSYTVNSSNEMTANSNASYAYDYNGNTTSKTVSSATTDYAWDYENRMTSVTLPSSGGTVSFKYDPFGRRIKKSPTTTSIFAYDGDNLVETVNGTGGDVARYTDGWNIDEPLAESRAGTVATMSKTASGRSVHSAIQPGHWPKPTPTIRSATPRTLPAR